MIVSEPTPNSRATAASTPSWFSGRRTVEVVPARTRRGWQRWARRALCRCAAAQRPGRIRGGGRRRSRSPRSRSCCPGRRRAAVQPASPAVGHRVGHLDVEDAAALPVPRPPGGRVQARHARFPPCREVLGDGPVELGDQPAAGDPQLSPRLGRHVQPHHVGDSRPRRLKFAVRTWLIVGGTQCSVPVRWLPFRSGTDLRSHRHRARSRRAVKAQLDHVPLRTAWPCARPAKLVARAADLCREPAAVVQDNERRWRTTRDRIGQVVKAMSTSAGPCSRTKPRHEGRAPSDAPNPTPVPADARVASDPR
jgi:hypothetical protein